MLLHGLQQLNAEDQQLQRKKDQEKSAHEVSNSFIREPLTLAIVRQILTYYTRAILATSGTSPPYFFP
jgi:hypothetical protein